MESQEQKAAIYRQKAEEVLALANSMNDPQIRRLLERLAVDYLRLAQTMDDLAKNG